MTVLHTVNKAPSINLIERCAASLQSGDAVLFLEDGTYHCMAQNLFQDIKCDITMYFLKEDIIARGLADKVSEHANLANYRKFVELCAKHDKVISWF